MCAQLVGGSGPLGPTWLEVDAGQGLSELAGERAHPWPAGPAGAFIGGKGVLMWPKYVFP